MDRIAVIGAGSWGTTLASLAAASGRATLWARRGELAASINRVGENPDYLPGHKLSEGLVATADLGEALDNAMAVVMAVPSHGFRDVFIQVAAHLDPLVPIVSLTKGMEEQSFATMTQVITEEAPGHDPNRIGVLTGPNLAAELIAGQPTAAVVAMPDQGSAEAIRDALMGTTFRVYINDDVVGCELGGAMKNVMAIAAGMSDGLGFGDNTRAALITRALAELTRLGLELGGRPATFAGLAGMGDLIATCSSPLSRNHRVGVGLSEGKSLEQVIEEMRMVAEGVKTTRAVLGLANRRSVEVPIASHVGRVLYEGMHPRNAVLSLMTREAKDERE